MTFFTEFSIREKLMAIVMGVSFIAMLLTVAAFIAFENRHLKNKLYVDNSSMAKLIADRSSAALAFEDDRLGRENLEALRIKPSVLGACMYDAKGRVFTAYGVYSDGRDCPPASAGSGRRFKEDSLEVFEPVLLEGRQIGSVLLLTGFAELAAARKSLLLTSGIVIVFIALVVFAITARWQKVISGPLVRLAGTARLIAARGDYEVRAVKVTQDEIGELVDAFNAMLETIRSKSGENKKLNAGLEDRVRDRTARLEAANRELEAFSYSVSHDLRAPLRHINGYVELLQSRFRENLPEKGLHYLDTIADSARNMGVLIDALLDFSRTGRVEMKTAAEDMNALVGEVLKPLREENSLRKIEWTMEVLPYVTCDAVLVKQVWANLLNNAVKFTRPRAEAVIEVGCREEGGEFVFFVRDNGVGFDMNYSKNLFGVFQRLHSQEEFEGTGIGLANVRRIIVRHGGRIWAEAEPGKGAVFYFTLPKNKGEVS